MSRNGSLLSVYTARCASKARITIYAQARHRSGFVLPPISFHVSVGRGAK